MSEHSREVEGVLLVRADDQEAAGDRLAALEVVDRFQLRPLPARRIRDVYIDTDDGALAGSRVAFRLREQDGRPLLTLKADAVRSGLASERLELEAPWSAEALQAALEELRRRGVELPTQPEQTGAEFRPSAYAVALRVPDVAATKERLEAADVAFQHFSQTVRSHDGQTE